jgi:glutathione synthase/RimK-type ligase-like ATP-grasp enzyme
MAIIRSMIGRCGRGWPGNTSAKPRRDVACYVFVALKKRDVASNVGTGELLMKKIGILFGMENTFPPAFVEKVNSMKVDGVTAEFVKLGGVKMADPSGYRVIVDRISQDIPFYRAYLKNAVLNGTIVVNNPFWWTADDKFFNYALASKLGVAIPPTVLLPHNKHPEGTTDQSMRNLIYPLNWEEIFEYVGFPAFLKPYSGGGWKHVYKVHSPEEFFHHYNQTGDLCMTLQHGVEFKEYFRCYVVGQEKVRIMYYDPRAPFHERYVRNPVPAHAKLLERVEKDALTLCRALGYDLNTVEFAVEDGIPYAIDFMNPAPDAEATSVGQENFEWVVNAVAEMAVKKALSDENPARELRWAAFLAGPVPVSTPESKAAPRKRVRA